MFITEDIRYIGVNDHDTDLFEGQYKVPNGISYNSYVIKDEKIAVMDTVEAGFTDQWLDNLKNVLDGRNPDYLIVQHMEPDHSANIENFMKAYPNATIVATAMAFAMMKNYFGTDFSGQQLVVGDKDTLSLGKHVLTFITAPMVHWPEVIMTYDSTDKVLFSADGFGKFGALDTDEEWADEARRYYIGIVGKYGSQTTSLLKKAAGLDIQTICPLHGPVLNGNLDYYMNLYSLWAGYLPEEDGVIIAYTSVYGHTKKAVELLARRLRENGCSNVVIADLARCDMSQAVADAFRYSGIVLATTTYNGDIFPFMKEFINHLTERNFGGRTVAFIENGSWAPVAAKKMKEMLSFCKNLNFARNTVTLHSALNEDSTAQVAALADELCGGYVAEEEVKAEPEIKGKKFVCKICGYVYEGDSLPRDFVCPVCKRGAEDFEEEK